VPGIAQHLAVQRGRGDTFKLQRCPHTLGEELL
jgi:hypothetical protein